MNSLNQKMHSGASKKLDKRDAHDTRKNSRPACHVYREKPRKASTRVVFTYIYTARDPSVPKVTSRRKTHFLSCHRLSFQGHRHRPRWPKPDLLGQQHRIQITAVHRLGNSQVKYRLGKSRWRILLPVPQMRVRRRRRRRRREEEEEEAEERVHVLRPKHLPHRAAPQATLPERRTKPKENPQPTAQALPKSGQHLQPKNENGSKNFGLGWANPNEEILLKSKKIRC